MWGNHSPADIEDCAESLWSRTTGLQHCMCMGPTKYCKTNAESISGGVLQKLAVVSIRNFSRITRYLKKQRGIKKACGGQRNTKDLNYLCHCRQAWLSIKCMNLFLWLADLHDVHWMADYTRDRHATRLGLFFLSSTLYQCSFILCYSKTRSQVTACRWN